LRRGFIDVLKQNNTSETKIDELVGHAVESLAMRVYARRYKPQILHETGASVDYKIDVLGLIGSHSKNNGIPQKTDKEEVLSPDREKANATQAAETVPDVLKEPASASKGVVIADEEGDQEPSSPE